MNRDFLGTGWDFPVRTDHQGNIRVSEAGDSIERSVRLVLGTAKGERIMRPDFGCDIHDHVFASTSPTNLTMMEDSVREALVRWEPRIDVERVEATPDPSTPNLVRIEVRYWIRNTNTHSNLVYPFYVQEGD